MEEHLENIQKSFKDLKSTPIIAVPSAFLFISMFFMIFLVLIQLFAAAFPFEYIDKIIMEEKAIGDHLDSVNWGLLLVFAVIDLVLYYFIIAYYRAIHYGVIGDISKRGNSSFERMLHHGKTYFLNMLSYSVAKALLTNGILIALLSIPLILAMANVMHPGLALFLGVFLFLSWFFLVALPISVVTVFAFPLVFDKKKGGFQILWESLTYSKNNFQHVLLTWLVALFLGLCFNLVVIPIDLIASILPPLLFVSFIVSWVLGIVLNLYIFNSYFSKNKKKTSDKPKGRTAQKKR